MLLDRTSLYGKAVSLAPIVISDNTLQVGATLDLQTKESVNFDILTGVLADADATFDTKLFAGNASDMSDEVEVTSADELIGSVSDFLFSDDGAVISFGYKGVKRYVRVKIQPALNSGSAPLAILATYKKKKVGSFT